MSRFNRCFTVILFKYNFILLCSNQNYFWRIVMSYYIAKNQFYIFLWVYFKVTIILPSNSTKQLVDFYNIWLLIIINVSYHLLYDYISYLFAFIHLYFNSCFNCKILSNIFYKECSWSLSFCLIVVISELFNGYQTLVVIKRFSFTLWCVVVTFYPPTVL